MLHSELLRNLLEEYAYLDPGSGSLLLQLLLGAILAIGIFIRYQWGRIKNLFGKDSKKDDDASEE